MKPADRLLERIKAGSGIVIYGFEQGNHETTQFVEAIRAGQVDCPLFSVSQKISAFDASDAFDRIFVDMEAVRNRVRQHKPVILTVKTALEDLSAAKGDIFQDELMLDKICVADGLTSFSRSDLFVVPNAQTSLQILQRNQFPQTPIESELNEAMSKLGLCFNTQVPLGRFTADFVAWHPPGTTSVVVEADGAAFHDAIIDQRRDEEIMAQQRMHTLRFSGSKIYSDADACAQEVQEFLKTSATKEAQEAQYGYEKLDPSQKKAVEHGDGHARVLAPAGSGKTRVLVNRVSYLLNSGVKPGSLMVIAFNKNAVHQLEERLEKFGVPVAKNFTDRSGVVVKTFNALGYQLLLDNGFKGNLLFSDELRKLVRDAISKSGIQIPTVRGFDNLDRVIKQIARVCRGLMNPNTEELELMALKGETKKFPFPPIYTAVRQLQSERGKITFDDQIFYALRLMMADPLARHKPQRRFQYILVDEYQDLNKAQISLIRALASGNGQVFAVGDDDQLIYSWRQAKTQHLLKDFDRFFPEAATFPLETNYRCAQRIVTLSQRLIAHNQNRFPKTVNPSPCAQQGDVVVQAADSIKSQSQHMVAFLKAHHKPSAGGDPLGRAHYKPDICDWTDMAVLSRTKVQLIEVARALDEERIPRSILPNVSLFSSHIGRVLHRYLRIIHSPDEARGEDYAEIINRPNRYTTNEFKEDLSHSSEPIRCLQYYVDDAERRNARHQADPVKKLLKDIRGLKDELNDRSLYDTVGYVISAFDLKPANLGGNAAELDEADDETILEIIAEEARRFKFLDQFLEHYESQARRETDGDDDQSQTRNGGLDADTKTSKNVVLLNTIHAAKGKEWALCFIFDARDTTQREAKSVQTSPAENEEERRVFYVAMTRAQRFLGITTRTSRPSSFLREAFISPEAEKTDIINLQKAVHEKEVPLADKKVELNGLKSQMLHIKSEKFRQDKELEKQLEHSRKQAPTGFLKCVTIGGFSMRDIKARIDNLRSSFVKKQLEKIKLEIDRLERQIDLSLADLNDTKNVYEIFLLFQRDTPNQH